MLGKKDNIWSVGLADINVTKNNINLIGNKSAAFKNKLVTPYYVLYVDDISLLFRYYPRLLSWLKG